MTDTKAASLREALVRLQAELPTIAKGKTGKVQGKDGKQGYSYQYADLADITTAMMPLLAKHGLAFTSKPTRAEDGAFVLAYRLLHESGDDDAGEYLLPSPECISPQQLGSHISYARRYCLCAVTGVAPHGDDDDGHAAGRVQQDDWRSQPPVQRERFAHTDAAHERLVESAEDRRNGKKAERVKGKAPDDEWTKPVTTDPDWLKGIEDEIKKFTSDDYGRVLWRRVNEKTEAGGCSKEDGENLHTLIRARHKALAVEREPAEVPADAS